MSGGLFGSGLSAPAACSGLGTNGLFGTGSSAPTACPGSGKNGSDPAA